MSSSLNLAGVIEADQAAESRKSAHGLAATKKIRVVHLGKYYPPAPGGIEGHTQTLARAQAALGADVRVVVVNHAAKDGRDVTFKKFTRTPSAEENDGQIRVFRVGRLANIAKFDVAWGLGRTLKEIISDPPDIWHLHTPNVTMMLAVLTNPKLRPLVITHHSDIVRQRVLGALFRPIERAAYSRAVRILPTSPAYIEGSDLLQRFQEKVVPVPLGMDLAPFQNPSPAALHYAAQFREHYGSPLWLAVGRIIYYKGLHIALEALKDVPGKLLVIGTGPLESALKQKAIDLGVADRVIWYGHASQNELIGAYHAATAFWFPSIARSEGFGLVQVEAMASGCPVINTAIPGSGVSWVCRHEREGYTAHVNNPEMFADMAKRLLDTEVWSMLSANGRKRVVNEFDSKMMAARTLAIYQEVLK